MRAALFVCLLLSLCVSQQTPPQDQSCGASDCVQPEPRCTGTPNCVPNPALTGAFDPQDTLCGCQCPGCPSCVQRRNNEFKKLCSVDLVMVLDESGSIGCCTKTVRNAVISFVNSFSLLNGIGGSATLGLLEFSGSARLVNTGFNGDTSGKMLKLTPAYATTISSYVNNQISTVNNQGYSPGGCTNWDEALMMAHRTDWKIDNGTPRRPDILLFFTDGDPTVHSSNKCETDCNKGRTRRATNDTFFVGACNGNHVGGACYWADQIKAAGVKIFLVGVGSVPQHIPNTQLVTGLVEWDQQVSTFGKADYVANADYAKLGELLNAVAKSLCPCLQDQTPCVNFGGVNNPTCDDQSNFDAYAVITTTSQSAVYPPNAVTEGFMYYDFYNLPPRFALEYMENGVYTRTDTISPCNVQRQISCAGVGCFNTADLGFMPRFFLAAGDIDQALGPGPLPSHNACRNSGIVKAKSGQVSGSQSQIQFIWMVNAGGTVSICAARAQDGTLYEFFTASDKQLPGVNLHFTKALPPMNKPFNIRTNPTQLYNFSLMDSCNSPVCNAEVEVVFAIDQNMAQGDYYLALLYVKALSQSFSDANDRIRMGAVFTGTGDTIPFTSTLSSFGNQVLSVTKPAPAVATDFFVMANRAIDTFWPTARRASDPPRYLLTIVGSVDTHGIWSPADQLAFDSLRVKRDVDAWAVGTGDVGGTQTTTLAQLSEPAVTRNVNATGAGYDHYVALASSSLLASQVPDQAARMCPMADLCGGTCFGKCTCGVCSCPTCAVPADKCQTVSCASSSAGCVVLDKRSRFSDGTPTGGCLPPQPLPCTSYDCNALTGACLAPTTPCGAGCGCTAAQLGNCSFNDLSAGCGACTPKTIVCTGDLCGGGCDITTGTCSNVPLNCNDNNACTRDDCTIRVIGGVQTSVCTHARIDAERCKPANECEVTNCTSTGPQSWDCQRTNLTSLIDLCGVCLGDFSTCFFASVKPVSAGIAGGVIAGIVVAALIAAALIIFGTTKGYLAWQAQSNMAAAHAVDNAAFQPEGNAGYTRF